MYLHFDPQLFAEDLRELAGAFAKGTLGYDKHTSLSKSLLHPASPKTNARFQIVANCVDCAVSVERAVQTVWERGRPVSVSLLDQQCPHCKGQKGFHYAQAKALHA